MSDSTRNKRPTSYITAIGFLAILIVGSCSDFQHTSTSEQASSPSILQQEQKVLSSVDSSSDETVPNSEGKDVTNIKVDSLLEQMSLEEKIGQLFSIRAYGNYKSQDDHSYQELLHKINTFHVGGITFFSGDTYGQTVLTNKLQRASDIPLWISEDMEYGAAMRLSDATRFPPAMAVAATQNPRYAYWMGKITAKEAKALGVNQIFGPVLDVNNNPDNPVINVRSFSGDPDTVSAYGTQFINGVQSEGLVSTAKHFPGHGDTDTDSHLSLPVIKYGYSRLDSVELAPFRAAIRDSISSVMSAHIAYPSISSENDLPATMDSTMLNGILRDSLGFSGMVVSDALEMRGISSHYSPGEAVIKALKAGVDLMVLSPDELTAIHEVKVAVQNGRIAEKHINNSARKLLQWKKDNDLFKRSSVNISSLSNKIGIRSHKLKADEIGRKSLTLVKNKNDLLPIKPQKFPDITVISVSDGHTGNAGNHFVDLLRNHHRNVHAHVLDDRSGPEEKKQMMTDAQDSDLVIIGSFIYVRSGQSVQLSDDDRRLLKRIYRDTPSLLVAFGNPYVVQDLADTDAQLMAWASSDQQVENTVPALFGGSEINGKLPIRIPGMYDFGDGISLPKTTLRKDEPEMVGLSSDSLQNVKAIMNQAVLDSTFPGGVVAVVKDGVLAYQKGFGYQTYDKLDPTRKDDIYDLASLTKVTATTPAIMKLVDEDKISLDDRVGKYVDAFNQSKKQDITIRNLLLHNSGLPAFRVYVDSIKTEPKILHAIKNEPLIYEPGTKYEYSDLGFILLGEIVEQVSGMPLDDYVEQKLYRPMGMLDTFYTPNRSNRWLRKRIPPTEVDTTYRMKTLKAQVNDERAYYLNGVAGHAGLFSSAGDLAAYCQMLLNKGSYGGNQYLQPSTVSKFTKQQSELVNRGYGFDRKSKRFSTAGSLSSLKTFGHLGFTGTSYWIDPEKDIAIILLTNRTYPHRSYGENINEIRGKVADAVISSIIKP